MKILILGGSGFLGTYLKKFFKNKKVKFLTSGRHKNNNIILKNYQNENLNKLIINYNPTFIINLVAITKVDICEKKKFLSKKINTTISKNLSEIIIGNKLESKLIYVSTDQVYSGYGKKSEKFIKIINHYSRTKYDAEKYVLKSKGCVLRTNFFGMSNSKDSLVNWIIESNKKKKEINVFNNVYFSPLYVKTVCKYIYLACRKNLKGIYNLGSNDCISKAEFAFYIVKKLKLENKYLINSKYTKDKLIAKRPTNMCMNSNKFYKKLNIKSKNSYQELNLMLRDLVT